MQPRTRLYLIMAPFLSAVLCAIAMSEAQAQPGGKKGKGGGPPESADSFIAKMMAFNKAKDGRLTKTELTDTRLQGLFDRADANKDGVVTREELQALFTREQDTGGGFGKGGFGDKGKGFDGKKDGKGKGKGKGKGGPQPGTILPPFVQDALNLTDSQKKQVADLQSDVDAKLNTILTSEQRAQLREMFAQKGFGDKKGPPFGKKGGPK